VFAGIIGIMWRKQNNELYQQFVFRDFTEAFTFMQQVAMVAERLNHHPRWLNEWNKVQFWLHTHSAGGVTEKDEVLAAEIDKTYKHLQEAWGSKALPQLKEVKVFTDGGSRGNPGPSAGAYVITDMADIVVKKNGKYLGITSNNMAEYHSLKGGLEAATAMGARVVHVYMDSMLVINQMKGIYKIKNQELVPVHQAIRALLPSFEQVQFTHVPREYNKLADAEVNEILDGIDDNTAEAIHKQKSRR
jgi:pterin-4a-carbinolamine dehydratase/ribonuclease HI